MIYKDQDLDAMQQPLEIVFEDFEPSDAISDRLRDEMAKLEQFNDRLTSARVVIAKPHKHNTKGNHYQVRIHITAPGMKDVIVNQDPGNHNTHEDAYVTIRDAFRAARRQIQDAKRND